MRKDAILLRQHAPLILGSGRISTWFACFYQDEIRWRRGVRVAIPIDVPLSYGIC